MTYFCQSGWVLASTSSFVLLLILSATTTNVDAQQKPSPQKRKSEPATASEESPIEKLGRMIVGTWAINEYGTGRSGVETRQRCRKECDPLWSRQTCAHR